MNRNISWNKNWTSLTIKLKKRTKKFYYNYKYCFWTNSILEMFKRKSDSVITIHLQTKKIKLEIFWLTESNLQLLPHIIKNDCTTTTRLFFLYFLIQVKTGIMMNFFEVLLLIKDTTKRIKLWIWCVHYFPNCRKKLWKRWKGNASALGAGRSFHLPKKYTDTKRCIFWCKTTWGTRFTKGILPLVGESR